MNLLVLLCLIVQIVVHTTKAAEANLPPSLYVQSRVSCMEGGSVDINTARIDDHDASQFLQPKIAVNISVLHGQLYLPVRSGLFFINGNMVGTDNRFELLGRLPDIQKAISVIKYLADADFNGDDTLTISATDMHLQARSGAEPGAKLELLADNAPVSVSTTITVEPVNDAPVIVASARFLTCDQQQVNDDGTPAVSTASFSATFSDADVRTPEQMLQTKFQLNLSTRYGTLRSTARGCDQSTYSCTVTGTLDELNVLAQKVTYTPDAQYNKYTGSERIVIVLEELNSPLREGEINKPATVTIPVIVRPTNHAPTVSTPIALSTSEDELLSLAGLAVDDVDVRDTVTVTVSVASGGLIQLSAHEVQPFKQTLKAYLVQRLSQNSDVLAPHKNAESQMQFTGSTAAVRAALSTLYFLPAVDWYGLVSLTIKVVDAGMLEAKGGVRIVVDAVNDPPAVRLASSVLWTNESTPVTVTGVSFVDPDLTLDGVMQVTLEATHGTLNLDLSTFLNSRTHLNNNPVQLLEGDAQNSTYMVMIGRADDLDTLFLKGLQFLPSPHVNLHRGVANGVGTVKVTVREYSMQSHSVVDDAAAARSLQSSALIQVYVKPVNNAPVVSAPVTLTTLEDTPLLLTNITVSDLDWQEIVGTTFAANVSAMFGTLSVDAGVMYRLGLYRNPKTGGTSPLLHSTQVTSSDGSNPEQTYNSVLTFHVQSLDDLNLLLSSVTYTPPLNRNGEDYLQVAVSDGGAAVLTRTTLLLSAVNDLPVVTAPAHIVTAEDTPYAIGTVSIDDVDFLTNPSSSALLTVLVNVTTGKIKMEGTEVKFLEGSASDQYSGRVLITGTLSGVNYALSSLNYQPELDFTGLDTITLTVTDKGHFGANEEVSSEGVVKRIQVFVSPVADLPSITLSPLALSGSQATPASYYVQSKGVAVSGDADVPLPLEVQSHVRTPLSTVVAGLTDRDAMNNPISIMRLACQLCEWTLDPAALGVSVYRPTSESVTTIDANHALAGPQDAVTAGTDFVSENVVFVASSVANLNAALSGMFFAPSISTNGMDIVSISLVTDLVHNTNGTTFRTLVSTNVPISIRGRTQKPTLSGPASLAVVEDVPQSVSTGTKLFAFSSDPLLSDMTCRVSLNWDAKVVTSVAPAENSPYPDPSHTEVPCGEVTNFLNALVVIPQPNVNYLNVLNDEAYFTVTVEAPTAVESSDSSELDVTIHTVGLVIQAVDDAPLIVLSRGNATTSATSNQVVLTSAQDDPLYLSFANIVDVDNNGQILELQLSCNHCAIIWSRVAYFASIPVEAKQAAIRGTVSVLNAALQSAYFIATKPHWHGTDVLDFSVLTVDPTNRKNNTLATTVSASVSIEVTAVNVPPSLTFHSRDPSTTDVVMQEREVAAVFNYTVTDPDSQYLSLTLEVSAESVAFPVLAGQPTSWGSSVTINSTAVEIGATLSTLLFRAPENPSVELVPLLVVANLTVRDGSANGVVTKSLNIYVLPRNDPPGILVPEMPVQCSAIAPAKLDMITITDLDSVKLVVEISLLIGDVGSLLLYPPLRVQVLQQNASFVRLSGKAFALNAALASIVFAPTQTFVGNTELTVTVYDGAEVVHASMWMNVVASKPVGELRAIPVPVILEDQPEKVRMSQLFALNYFDDAEVLSLTLSSDLVCLDASALSTSTSLRAYLVATTKKTEVTCHDLTVRGTVHDLQSLLLPVILLHPSEHFHGIVAVRAVLANEDGNTQYASASVQVLSVNDAPSVVIRFANAGEYVVPAKCAENSANCLFSMTFSDIDATDRFCHHALNRFSVELNTTVPGAYFRVLSPSGTEITSNVTGQMRFESSPAQFNNQPLGLQLVLPSDWYGNATVSVLVSDGGMCGYDETYSPVLSSALVTQPLEVTPVDDPASLLLASSYLTCIEDTSCALPTITLRDTDMQVSHQSLTVQLTALHGDLAVSVEGMELIAALGDSFQLHQPTPSVLNVTTSDLAALTAFLNDFVQFVPDANFNGAWPRRSVSGESVPPNKRFIRDPLTDLASIVYTLSSSDGWAGDIVIPAADTSQFMTRLRVSVNPVNDAPTIVTPFSELDVTDSVVQMILRSVEVNDADYQDPLDSVFPMSSQDQPRFTFVVACSDSGLVSLPLEGAVQAGVQYDASNFQKSAELVLTGTLSAVQKSLQFVQFDGSLLQTEWSNLTLTAIDAEGLSTRLEVPLRMAVQESRGFALAARQPWSNGVLQVNKHSIAALGDSVQLSRTAFSALNDTSLLQGIVRSDGRRGEISSTSTAAQWSAPVVRSFVVSVTGPSAAKPSGHKLTLEVPWRFEQQAVEIFTSQGQALTSGVDCSVSLTVYSMSQTVTFSVESMATLDQVKDNFHEALRNMRNVGAVQVTAMPPNSTASNHLFGTIYVTFTGNSGDVPPLTVQPLVATSSISFVTSEISKGSLAAEVQDISLSASVALTAGNFVLVFTHDPYLFGQHQTGFAAAQNVWSDRYVESALLSFDATPQQVQDALGFIPGIGLISVTAQPAATGATYSKIWRVSFLTYGANVAPLVAVADGFTSDETHYGTTHFSEDFFEPFSSASAVLSVNSVSDGTQTVNGAFKLGLRVMVDNEEQVFDETAELAPNATPASVRDALLKLRGVVSADAKQLHPCSIEGRCDWALNVTTTGEYPGYTFIPITTGIVGTDVRLYSNLEVAEVLPPAGNVYLALRMGDAKLATAAVVYNASTDKVASALNVALNGVSFSAQVTRSQQSVDTERVRVEYAITLVHVESRENTDIYHSTGGQPVSLLQTSDLPGVYLESPENLPLSARTLTGSDLHIEVSEVSAALTSPHARYLLSVTRPDVPTVAEVQTIYCASTVTLPVDGLYQSVQNPEMVSFSFRNFTTESVWIHSFLTPSQLPRCADQNVTTGAPCAGDGKTVLEKLLSLQSLPYLQISSNSTTGRLCPSNGGIL